MDLLVFSDLDGTLLDHATYSWEAARPGLERLGQLGAGLVLASSKTAAEIRSLQHEIGCAHWPAIVENGAGILWPNDERAGQPQGGTDYARLRAILDDLPTPMRGEGGFEGFSDMEAARVADLTGLTPEKAALAKTRQHSEPGLWHGDAQGLEAFLAALERAGVHARRGGRFLTLSFGTTKAQAMAQVVAALKPKTTIALGDAPNDLEMIEAADHGVIVHNPHAPPIETLPSERHAGTIRTQLAGPAGWSEAIVHLTDGMITTAPNAVKEC
ncbi:MAG: HAD-IIB family hydrolase [Devosiaceae bacterium]|nr:HAD-IIB family hydrolase [Devosiaceae bacterium MH13]